MDEDYIAKAYPKWVPTVSREQLKLVVDIYAMANARYERGGDRIVEAHTPQEVLEGFRTLTEAEEYCDVWADRG